MRGWSLDAETTLRWLAFGERRPPGDSSTVVIALDDETYASPPFKGSPTMTWTGDIGRVVSAVIEGGAQLRRLRRGLRPLDRKPQIRFGDATVGDRLRGFDRDYLAPSPLADAPERSFWGRRMASANRSSQQSRKGSPPEVAPICAL